MDSWLKIILLALLLPQILTAQEADYAGVPQWISRGGTTTIGQTDSCTSCRYTWSPATGLDDPHKANPVVTGIPASTEYSVTVTLPNGNTVVNFTTVYLYMVDIAVFKPRFLQPFNAPEQLVPRAQQRIPGVQTMVNIDNDDLDAVFDDRDTLVKNGDDELVKIRVQLSAGVPKGIKAGTETKPKAMLELTQQSNSEGVRFWRSADKAAGEYFPGQAIEVKQGKVGNYEGFIWAEGIKAHTVPQQTKLTAKVYGDTNNYSDNDYISLTIIGIQSIEWLGAGNGYTGDGKNNSDVFDEIVVNGQQTRRVFAEGKYDGKTVTAAKTTVKMKITFSAPPVEAFPLFIRAFDLDDPVADATLVDPNDAGIAGIYFGSGDLTYSKEEDNRSAVSFWATSKQEIKQKFGAVSGTAGDVVCEFPQQGIFRKNIPPGAIESSVWFEVSQYPGDNYRIAVYSDPDFLKNLRNEDQFDQGKIVDRTTGVGCDCREISASYISAPLMVFRTLHVECDQMQPANTVAANENQDIRDVWFTDFELAFNGPKIALLKFIDDANEMPAILKDRSVLNGRWEGGDVKIGNLSFPKVISATNDNSVFFGNDTGNKPNFNGLNCKIVTSTNTVNRTIARILKAGATGFEVTLENPDPNLPTYGNAEVFLGNSTKASCKLTLIPGSTQQFKLCAIKIPVVLRDDDWIDGLPFDLTPAQTNIVKAAFLDARVDVAFDGGGNNTFNQSHIPFKINIQSVKDVQDFYNSYADSRLLEQNSYWIANLILGWQGQQQYDGDPVQETDVQFGLTPIDKVEKHCTVASGFDVSYICLEDIRDAYYNSGSDYEVMTGYVIAHEIGLQFGLTPGVLENTMPWKCADCITNCLDATVMTAGKPSGAAKFAELHVNLLRSRIKPPKLI